MVGLNRRFAPMTKMMKKFIGASGPMQMVYRVNSGSIPPIGWLHNPEEGGGMLIGEMCHFVDLMQFAGENLLPYLRTLNTTFYLQLDNVLLQLSLIKVLQGLSYSTLE
jgi:predicted dehydrogenase